MKKILLLLFSLVLLLNCTKESVTENVTSPVKSAMEVNYEGKKSILLGDLLSEHLSNIIIRKNNSDGSSEIIPVTSDMVSGWDTGTVKESLELTVTVNNESFKISMPVCLAPESADSNGELYYYQINGENLVVIPQYYNGVQTLSIGGFWESTFTKVVVPKGIVELREDCFSAIPQLETLIVTDDLTYVGNFSDHPNKLNIYIKSKSEESYNNTKALFTELKGFNANFYKLAY